MDARYEPFGLSVLEAALAGCALVLGDVPSLRELWDDAAVFVAPDDADALRGALAALIADARGRTRLAERAHERAGSYDTERMAAAYLALYSRLGDGTSTQRLIDSASGRATGTSAASPPIAAA